MFESEMNFVGWPSIPRLSKERIVITEKLDGTNACIVIRPAPFGVGALERSDRSIVLYVDGDLVEFAVQSRKRFITPASDNFGFATWAYNNAEALISILGYGQHYGEWWGLGIQRGYGLKEKRFSLFNAPRWMDGISAFSDKTDIPGLRTVPVLYAGQYDPWAISAAVEMVENGSVAAPEFTGKAEGVIIYHRELNASYKRLLENDDLHKWQVKE